MVGLNEEANTVYMIDFGLAKRFRNENGQHINFSDNCGMVGTQRYASIYAHLGMEQSRRDDLERLGYTLIFLYKGSLP